MPLSRTLFHPPSPADAVRQALIGSLYKIHRPELADLVAAADLAFAFAGVWLRPMDATVSPAWLEAQLAEAALESGLPLVSIRVLEGTGQGRGESEGETAGLVVPGLRPGGARRARTVSSLL